MLIALTREVSPSIDRCELTHVERTPIDVPLAREQHRAYERALEAAGCTIVRVEPAPDLPDSVFVEDVAVVFEEAAVMMRPGSPSRRHEVPAVDKLVAGYREVHRLEAPATMDGGDVLVAGRRVFVGRSARTNAAAVARLRAILHPYGYAVQEVGVSGCLHLKSAVTALGGDRLLINREWVDVEAFSGFALVEIEPRERFAANVVAINGACIFPAAFPRTRERLEALGLDVRTVEVGEIAKAEGAVTCCSVVFEGDQRKR